MIVHFFPSGKIQVIYQFFYVWTCTYSPPKSCMPKSAKMRMNRKRRNSKLTMERILLSRETTKFRRDAQYLWVQIQKVCIDIHAQSWMKHHEYGMLVYKWEICLTLIIIIIYYIGRDLARFVRKLEHDISSKKENDDLGYAIYLCLTTVNCKCKELIEC